jgi:hypothetical protein
VKQRVAIAVPAVFPASLSEASCTPPTMRLLRKSLMRAKIAALFSGRRWARTTPVTVPKVVCPEE